MERYYILIGIAILFILFLLYSKYRNSKGHLAKSEFSRIATQRAHTPEETDRHWRDYKRRF